MNEKEILAQLKNAYEYIVDITGNCDRTQIGDISKLEEVENILAEKYEEVYRKIKSENDISLYYEEDLLISDCICCDYLTSSGKDDQYLPYMDIKSETKWWEDYGFLTCF